MPTINCPSDATMPRVLKSSSTSPWACTETPMSDASKIAFDPIVVAEERSKVGVLAEVSVPNVVQEVPSTSLA